MPSYTIALSDRQALTLERIAQEQGVTPEVLLLQILERQIPTGSPPEFQDAADLVLRKNAELYRRLA